MKKTLSIILALVMIVSCFAVGFSAFAADKTATCKFCKNACTGAGSDCDCCAECPYVDSNRVLACVNQNEENGEYEYCCKACDGIWPCDCGFVCGCESCMNNDIPVDDGSGSVIVTPEQQNSIIRTFQRVMSKLNAIFDDLFEKIFEFLKFDQIMGKNK